MTEQEWDRRMDELRAAQLSTQRLIEDHARSWNEQFERTEATWQRRFAEQNAIWDRRFAEQNSVWNERFTLLVSLAQRHEERLDAVTERLDAVTERLDAVTERLDTLGRRVDGLAAIVERHEDGMVELRSIVASVLASMDRFIRGQQSNGGRS